MPLFNFSDEDVEEMEKVVGNRMNALRGFFSRVSDKIDRAEDLAALGLEKGKAVADAADVAAGTVTAAVEGAAADVTAAAEDAAADVTEAVEGAKASVAKSAE